jgi:hypothetical protein
VSRVMKLKNDYRILVGESHEKHPHRGSSNWKNNVMMEIGCKDGRWMKLAQGPCPNPGFGVRDVQIKNERIRFCYCSISANSSHRGRFY